MREKDLFPKDFQSTDSRVRKNINTMVKRAWYMLSEGLCRSVLLAGTMYGIRGTKLGISLRFKYGEVRAADEERDGHVEKLKLPYLVRAPSLWQLLPLLVEIATELRGGAK